MFTFVHFNITINMYSSSFFCYLNGKIFFLIQALSNIFYPSTIKDLVGKEVTLKIEIGDDNVLLQSRIFKATDAYDDAVSSSSSSLPSMPGFSGTSSTDVSILVIFKL